MLQVLTLFLTLDSAAGQQRVCQELEIKGSLNTNESREVSSVEILIKTNSGLRDDGSVVARGSTDFRGDYFIRTNILESWGSNVDLYAVFLGDETRNSSVSDAKSLAIREKYDYESTCTNVLTPFVPPVTPPIPPTVPPTASSVATAHNTTLELEIQSDLDNGLIKIRPKLNYDAANYDLNISTVQIFVNGDYSKSVQSNKWSEISVDGDEVVLSAYFPGMNGEFEIFPSSFDTIKISKESLSISDTLIISDTPAETVRKFVASWDFGSVLVGLMVASILKFGFDRHYLLQILKNVVFVLLVLAAVFSFIDSIEKGILSDFRVLDMMELIPFVQPDFMLFGAIIPYAVSDAVAAIIAYRDRNNDKN